MVKLVVNLIRPIIRSAEDLLTIIIIVISFFQFVILQQPLPNLEKLLIGTAMVMFGLALFVKGLEVSLFPIGESLAYAFARKGSVSWLLIFGFCLGFGTTISEPVLIAVAKEAAKVASDGGMIESSLVAQESYANGLRWTVAFSVGFAIVIGVIRIIKGWPIHYLIVVGYIGIIIMTTFAPKEIVGIAYDSGGVTTSTVTVPIVTALDLGLASTVPGRSALIDGFGLIAFASLFPIIMVMGDAQISHWKARYNKDRK